MSDDTTVEPYINIDVRPVISWTDTQLARAIQASSMHIQRSTGLDATPFLLYELLTEIQRLRLVLRGSKAETNE